MATSRYAPVSNTAAQPTSTQSTSSGSVSESSSGSKSEQGSSSATNMDSNSLGILNQLLAQLATGGTPALQAQRAAKDREVATLQSNRQGYSREAAFVDAQGLIAQTMRQALEKLIPSINTGALGSGASQSSMRALLTQRAAENAAQASAAQGLNAAVAYGGVANGMSNTIANLLAQSDPSTQALLAALGIAKGAVTQTTSSGSSQNSSTAQRGTVGTENKNITYGGTTPSFSTTPPVSSMGQFGPIDNSGGGDTIGTTADTLRQLYGNQTFDNYSF